MANSVTVVTRVLIWSAVAAAIGALGALIAPQVWFLYQLGGSPPNWDVVTAKGSDCQLADHRAVPNHHGIVAVLREANCPGDFAQGTGYNVVFVHPDGAKNTRDNLAFQYTPGFEGGQIAPLLNLVWKSSTLLEITAPGVIETVKVQKSEVASVKLTYLLGHFLSLWDVLFHR